jgi:DNA-binding GntR family transcriptional regulator
VGDVARPSGRVPVLTPFAEASATAACAAATRAIEAIAAGDRKAAERAMRSHLDNVAAALGSVAAEARVAS